MKSPEDIKKGLECCSQKDLQSCAECPYVSTNCAFKDADALAYIKQLEAKLSTKDDMDKRMEDDLK